MPSSLQQGINAAKAGKMQDALAHLKDAIIEEPQNADVWVWIAAIIEDTAKQEIFLKKALEIDPDNIPAQRGMAYLDKRKRDEASVKGDHLSDHTSPITPFPNKNRPEEQGKKTSWAKPDKRDLEKLAVQPKKEPVKQPKQDQTSQEYPKLSPLELGLLGVIVIVFTFIGLLIASAVFDFSLPLDFLTGNQPKLSTEPPYPGVFLYENDAFIDIQAHTGPPTVDIGIPTSTVQEPLIVFFGIEPELEKMRFIYQTGDYLAFNEYQGKGNSRLYQAELSLEPGLYCLQETAESSSLEDSRFWCFKIANPTAEE